MSCPHGVMVEVVGYVIINRTHFRANALGKGMNPLILPAMD